MRKLLTLLMSACLITCATAQTRIQTQLPQFNRQLAKVKAGTGFARIMFVGDSLTAGYGAVTGSSYNGARPYSPTRTVVQQFLAAGINAQDDNFIGNQNVGSFPTAYDTRMTGGSGWTQTAGSSIGGSFLNSNGSTNAFTFQPTGNFDTIEITYGVNSTGGSFNVNVNGSNIATISCNNATSGVAFTKVSCTLGNWAIINTPTSTSNVYISSIVCYNSTSPAVIVMNAGAGALTSAYPTAYSPFGIPQWLAVQNTAPDLMVMGLMANDALNSLSSTTETTNLTAAITALKLYGSDLFMWTCMQPAVGSVTTANYNIYRTALFASTPSTQVPIADIGALFGPFTLVQSSGYASDSIIHLNTPGYVQLGKYLYSYIVGL